MKRPAWWTPPTFRYHGRRWADRAGAGRFDRLRRVALALWPFGAFLAALAVVAASMFAVVNIADQRDALVAAGKLAAEAAREAKVASEAAKVATEGNSRVLAELTPCNDGDDPNSPGCVRRARGEAVVSDLVDRVAADLARGIAAHDLNTHRALEELRQRLGGRLPPLRSPSPPPAAVAPTPAPAPTTTAAPPVVTTTPLPAAPSPTAAPTTVTTCPTLPNGKCRR